MIGGTDGPTETPTFPDSGRTPGHVCTGIGYLLRRGTHEDTSSGIARGVNDTRPDSPKGGGSDDVLEDSVVAPLAGRDRTMSNGPTKEDYGWSCSQFTPSGTGVRVLNSPWFFGVTSLIYKTTS